MEYKKWVSSNVEMLKTPCANFQIDVLTCDVLIVFREFVSVGVQRVLNSGSWNCYVAISFGAV